MKIIVEVTNGIGESIGTIHSSVMTSIIIVTLLIIFSFYAKRKIVTADPQNPTGLVKGLEVAVTTVNGMVSSTMGEKFSYFAPYIGTLITYIACANLISLTGLTAPTSDYNVTFGLAALTILYMHFKGFRSKGILGYIKSSLFEPLPFMLPLNLIDLVAKPLSISLRLFGNILSGGILLSLVYSSLQAIPVGIIRFSESVQFSVLGTVLTAVILPFLHAYFDVFVGLVQSYVFTLLTMIYISEAAE